MADPGTAFLPRIEVLEKRAEKTAAFFHVGVAYFLYLLRREGFFGPALVRDIKELHVELQRLARMGADTKTPRDALIKQEDKVDRLRRKIEGALRTVDGHLRNLAGKMRTLQKEEPKSWRSIVEEVAERNSMTKIQAIGAYNTLKLMLKDVGDFFETLARHYQKFREKLSELVLRTDPKSGINFQEANKLIREVEEGLLQVITDAEIEASKSKKLKESNRKIYLELLARLQQTSFDPTIPIESH